MLQLVMSTVVSMDSVLATQPLVSVIQPVLSLKTVAVMLAAFVFQVKINLPFKIYSCKIHFEHIQDPHVLQWVYLCLILWQHLLR